jgi:hypothetical protein
MKNRLLIFILLLQVHLSFSQDKTYIHPTTGQIFFSGSIQDSIAKAANLPWLWIEFYQGASAAVGLGGHYEFFNGR